MTDKWRDSQLANLLKTARALPRAGAKQKAMAAMGSAAAAVRSPRVLSRRNVVFAVAFVAALLAAGFWMLPKRHSIALADVARAMAQVKSAHFVVWTGQQRVAEVWVKGPDKCRVDDAEGEPAAADDGQRTVRFDKRGGSENTLFAIIDQPHKLEGFGELGEGMTYLDLLSGPGLMHSILETSGAKLTSSEAVTLPDGRTAVNATLAIPTPAGPTPEKMVITVDPDTNLVIAWERPIRWERQGDVGHGGVRVDKIDYDVEMADSLFSLDIPADAVVVDLLTPPSDQLTARGAALASQAKARGSDLILSIGPDMNHGGSCGSPYHTKLSFRFLDRNATEISYLPDRNTYYVVGRVLAWMSDGSGFRRVVEDEEFEAPIPPDSAPEGEIAKAESALALSAESIAQRDAKEKELRAAGATPLSKVDGSMATCGTPYHRGMFFQTADKSGFRLYYFPDRNVYYVMGKALVWCVDWQKTVENAEVEAPGPPVAQK